MPPTSGPCHVNDPGRAAADPGAGHDARRTDECARRRLVPMVAKPDAAASRRSPLDPPPAERRDAADDARDRIHRAPRAVTREARRSTDPTAAIDWLLKSSRARSQ